MENVRNEMSGGSQNASPLLFSIVQTQKQLGDISRSQVYLLISRGQLEALKIGRSIRVRGESIAALVSSLPAATIKSKA